MKKQHRKMLRAAGAMVLAAVMAGTLCSASGMDGAAATREYDYSTDRIPVLSYKEYYSKQQTIPFWSNNYTYVQQDIYPMWEGEEPANKDHREPLFVPGYEGTLDSQEDTLYAEYPVSGPQKITRNGIVFAAGDGEQSGLFMLNNDGVSLLCRVPAGMKITRFCGGDLDSVKFVTETVNYPKKEYVYRYYIPDNRFERLIDFENFPELNDLLQEHADAVYDYSFLTNEHVTFVIRPMASESDVNSPKYRAYLQEQMKRHQGFPERQEALQKCLNGDGDYGIFYVIWMTYNTRTQETNVQYCFTEYAAWAHKMWGYDGEI